MVGKNVTFLLLKHIFPALAITFLICSSAMSQQKKIQPGNNPPPVKPFYFPDHDSTYYQSFERYITARFYFSQKYSGLELMRSSSISRVRYIPNTSLTMGVGVTYQSISINLGYGFGFLNNDDEKGKTKYLDLQTHIYGRKWTTDLIAQLYKGYYLAPQGLAAPTPNSYYIRPDLKTLLTGVSVYRIVNSDKFSYRAATIQNEKQKKSAGSLLLGADLYYGNIRADSSLVPSVLQENYPLQGVRRMDFVRVGPGVGYAYTVVIHDDFFVTGSLSGTLNFSYNKQQNVNSTADKFSVNTGFIYRIIAGWDKNDWNINFSLVGNQMTITAATSQDKYLVSAGNFRFTVAKRLKPGRGLSKKLQPVDKVIENVKGVKPATH